MGQGILIFYFIFVFIPLDYVTVSKHVVSSLICHIFSYLKSGQFVRLVSYRWRIVYIVNALGQAKSLRPAELDSAFVAG